MSLSIFSSRKKSIKLLGEVLVGMAFCLLMLNVINWTIDYFVRYSNSEQTGKVNFIYRNKITEDIVCFGSSVTEVGFNSNLIAKKTGLSCYNLSIDGTRFQQESPLIRKTIEDNTNLKYVVLGLSFFELSPSDQLTLPSRFYQHSHQPDIQEMFHQMDTTLYLNLKQIPFYKFSQYTSSYYKNAFIGCRNLINGKKLSKPTSNGHTPIIRSFEATYMEDKIKSPEQLDISTKQVLIVSNLIRDIKAKNITPLIVIYPIYGTGDLYFSNYQEYIQTMIKLSNDNEIPLLDLSRSEVSSDKLMFYNVGHLNATGADVVSADIADFINKLRAEHPLTDTTRR